MIGFPRVLTTKTDFYNLKDTYPREIKRVLRGLMNERFIWIDDKEVAANQPHVNNEKIKVVETSKDNKKVYMQMKLVEDTNAEFYKLGWTIEEATQLLNYNKDGK